MTQRDWRRGDAHSLGVFLNGEKLEDTDRRASRCIGSSFLLLFNAYHEEVEFRLPNSSYGRRWTLALSSADPELGRGARWSGQARQSCPGGLAIDACCSSARPRRARSREHERFSFARPTGCSSAPSLGFAQARALVPYLRKLGVSHLYLSPALQARAGSPHGYDVVDPTRVSEELGGEREFRELAGAGLPIILDIVPNHMGIGEENRWWRDPELRERWFDLDPAGGYRRFFDIDDMAAIRQEREEVFETTHAKVLELLAEGLLDGLRVDHPDGLADPRGYLERLRSPGVERVWVEKILAAARPREALRDWPVSGTVGYEFLNDACALFVDPSAREPLAELLQEATGESRSFAEIALEAQLEQAAGPSLASSPASSVWPIRGPTSCARPSRPADLSNLRRALERASGGRRTGRRSRARDERGAGAGALCWKREDPVAEEFVTRFQQTSPAIAAKGVEDTAFYRYLRLLCLNEVGGDPDRFGLSVEDFHLANVERAERFPEGLFATQTHDTKRSGDARARLGALSTMPGQWRERVLRLADDRRAAAADPVGARPLGGVSDPPDPHLLLADRAGAPRRLPDQGPSGGKAQHLVAAGERVLGGGGARVRPPPPRVPGVPRRLRALRLDRRRGRRAQRARPAAVEADLPGGPRHLSGR